MTSRPRVLRRRAVATVAACALAAAVSGCTARAGVTAAPTLAVTSAYVPLPAAASPHTTVAFLDIRNDGAPDRLVAARTSVGGRVAFRAPTGQGVTMKTVTAISIPAATTVRLLPNDAHLVITGAGHMQGGKDITLVLTFARFGKVPVTAQVTDPQSGGSSYFTN
ncbi:MAG TPA: copper chaperone PCu(A)C [Streptosporangiaceae bacterium]|nr:copper chaperone PCu(A)C [Streptosporangiaceae bacterium]